MPGNGGKDKGGARGLMSSMISESELRLVGLKE